MAYRQEAVETLARTLRRYGVVFRRVLAREAAGVPWRELARVYRILEARREIRGGRFVSGMSGEQFLTEVDPSIAADVAACAAGRRVPVLRGYVGRLA